MAGTGAAPGHRAWSASSRLVADRAVELIEADRRTGKLYDWQAAVELVASRPRRDSSLLRVRRPEQEVAVEVAGMERRAVQMAQTDDWPEITMPGSGTLPAERA